jgi:hypothetical protein
MRALSAFILLGLLASGPALAQEEPKLPVHGWVRADFETEPVGGRAWVGVTIPFSRTTALAIDVIATDVAAGVNVGPTFEIGALYLTPMVGADYTYEGGTAGVAGTLLWAFEAPPVPIYLESWTRATLREPFGGSNDILWQLQVLATLRSWLALGPEYDALYAPIGQRRLGLRANFGITKNIVFGVFAGYEFSSAARAASTGLGPDWLAARGTLNFSY